MTSFKRFSFEILPNTVAFLDTLAILQLSVCSHSARQGCMDPHGKTLLASVRLGVGQLCKVIPRISPRSLRELVKNNIQHKDDSVPTPKEIPVKYSN